MDNIKVNYKQLARDIDVSYPVLLSWRSSRYALINYLIVSMKNDGRIANLETEVSRLKSKLNKVSQFAKE